MSDRMTTEQFTAQICEFSDSITDLKKSIDTLELSRIATSLLNTLAVLKRIFEAYPFMKSMLVFDIINNMIGEVKDEVCPLIDAEKHSRLSAIVNKLALSFCQQALNSVSSMNERIDKSNSFSVDISDFNFNRYEEVSNKLCDADNGVEVALERSKEIIKYIDCIMSYMEKRASIEFDYVKQMLKLTHNFRNNLKGKHHLPALDALYLALEHETTYFNTSESTWTIMQAQLTEGNLGKKRVHYENRRKMIRDQWHKSCKLYNESLTIMKKAKTSYFTKLQEYERSKDIHDENKRLKEIQSRLSEAEIFFRKSLADVNTKNNEMTKLKKSSVMTTGHMILELESVVKEVLAKYFQLLNILFSPLAKQYILVSHLLNKPQSAYADFIEHFPILNENESFERADSRVSDNFLDVFAEVQSAWSSMSFELDTSMPDNYSCESAVLQSYRSHSLCRILKAELCYICKELVSRNGFFCDFCKEAFHYFCFCDNPCFCVKRAIMFVSPFRHLPTFVKICCDVIDRKGVESKGIYRLSAVKSKIEKLFKRFTDGSLTISSLLEEHPNVIANVLKLFLRQLPKPLVSTHLYKEFMYLSCNLLKDNSDTEIIDSLKTLLSKLPDANYEALKYLILHLERVSDHEEENQMNANNLGIIFGPTIFDTLNNINNYFDSSYHIRFVEYLIFHARDIFVLRLRKPVSLLNTNHTVVKTCNSPVLCRRSKVVSSQTNMMSDVTVKRKLFITRRAFSSAV